MSQDVIINNAILNWPHLFQPKAYQGKGEPKFSCDIILPDGYDWTELQQAVAEAWAAKFPQLQITGAHKMPWLDKNLQPKILQEGPYAGRYFITVSSPADNVPQIVMQDPKVKAGPHQQGSFFSGAMVNFWGRAFGYEGTPNGVSIGINAIQLVRDDANLPRLDNRKSAAEVFQTIAGAPPATAAIPGQPAGFPGGATQQPMTQLAPGPGMMPAGFPSGPGMMPAGFPPDQAAPQTAPATMPAQGMPQGVPGAGVPTGAPAQAQAPGQPAAPATPWAQ